MYYNGIVLLMTSCFSGQDPSKKVKRLTELNANMWNIHLTFNYSFSTVEFLDLKINLKNGKIDNTLFRKKTATNSFVHYDSFHLRHLQNGIPMDHISQYTHTTFIYCTIYCFTYFVRTSTCTCSTCFHRLSSSSGLFPQFHFF